MSQVPAKPDDSRTGSADGGAESEHGEPTVGYEEGEQTTANIGSAFGTVHDDGLAGEAQATDKESVINARQGNQKL